MQTQIIETAHRQTEPADAPLTDNVMTAVGTFASGQSEHGSYHVAADAGLGSFASGIEGTPPSMTA